MDLVSIDRDGAMAVVERITLHVPAEEPAGVPCVIGPGVVITECDERFGLEYDADTGAEFVTRVRAVGDGTAEMTVFQAGRELARRTGPLDLGSAL